MKTHTWFYSLLTKKDFIAKTTYASTHDRTSQDVSNQKYRHNRKLQMQAQMYLQPQTAGRHKTHLPDLPTKTSGKIDDAFKRSHRFSTFQIVLYI